MRLARPMNSKVAVTPESERVGVLRRLQAAEKRLEALVKPSERILEEYQRAEKER